MAKLTLTFGGKTIKEYELDKEIISIGRKADNDIQIDNLAISNTHAKVLTILNDSFIEDLQSTNGTMINGKKMVKHTLTNGDMITVGKHQLEYVNEATEVADGDFEKTMIIQSTENTKPVSREESKKLSQSIGKIAADLDFSSAANTALSSISRLKLLNGSNMGKELNLDKILTTLGKPGVQVAAITRRPSGYFLLLVDPGSAAKRPSVNNIAIGSNAHPLNSGDVIEIAEVKMVYLSD